MSVRVKIFLAMMLAAAVLTAASISIGLIVIQKLPLEEMGGGGPVSKSISGWVLPYSMNTAAVFLPLGTLLALAASGKLVKQLQKTEDMAVRIPEPAETAASISEARSQIIADMRHEMRKPLNSVVRISRCMLDKEEATEETRDNVEKIHNAGMTLLGIINDILDVSKVETKKFEITPVEYDVPSLINDIVTLNAANVGDKPIRFGLHIGRGIPGKLFGDELRIELVCNNLLGNAFKFTQEGKIDLFFDCEKVGDSEWLTIRVADTGIGIPPEDMEGLFSGYNRVHSKSGGNIEGTRLPITKAIVVKMGGAITAESEYGKGSVFTVRLPQGFITDTPIEDEIVKNLRRFCQNGRWLPDETKIVHVQLPHIRVLVVDDIQANLDIMKELLELYGMKVDCLTSGWQAIQRISEETVFYDAVFMDHMMPEMDGVETVRVIRENIGSEYAQSIPIIALTANVTTENGKKYLEKGFQAFLSKPVDVFQLDAAVIHWLRSKEIKKEYFESHKLEEPLDAVLSLIGYPADWVSADSR
ncbi:MAG: response regulator [Synergistaceae bacterium]|nr:response regulator [Synergistaceae bacterium]